MSEEERAGHKKRSELLRMSGSGIALLCTVLGLVATIGFSSYQIFFQDGIWILGKENPELAWLSLVDLFFKIFLVSITTVVFILNTQRRKEYKHLKNEMGALKERNRLKHERNCLESAKCAHASAHSLRDLLSMGITGPPHKVTLDLDKIASLLLDRARDGIIIALEGRGYNKGDYGDVALALKLKYTGNEILGASEEDTELKDVRGNLVLSHDSYLITIQRDHSTVQAGKREIKKEIYSVNANEAFSMLTNGKGYTSCYTQNNLHLMKNYLNQNEHWTANYNAAQAVPVRMPKSSDQHNIIGFVCADSPNHEGVELFDDTTFHLISQAADLFALSICGNFDVYKKLKEGSV